MASPCTRFAVGTLLSGLACCAPLGALAEADTVSATTIQYVVRFYPRWFTYRQSQTATSNRMVGPARMTPVFGEVVAPNDDTLYVSSFLDLTTQPVVLTIPETAVTSSILTLDAYGDVFDTGISAGTPGSYALTGPGWDGVLPASVTRVAVPVAFSNLIIRADKYAEDGSEHLAEAEQFRRQVHAAPLSEYTPDTNTTLIVPVEAYGVRYKVLADDLIASDPIAFLRELQVAMAAPTTPPLSFEDRLLSDRFDRLFGDGRLDPLSPADRVRRAEFSRGAQAAHRLILARYHANTNSTNWISFTNIGAWGRHDLDRAAIAEYIQYGNGYSTAAYYQAFRDENGDPLDAGGGRGYVLTFAADQIPSAERFWSITAYLPESITLVPNDAEKYVVASYTPGLVRSSDGSITIEIAPEQPPGVPTANWLPVPRGRFTVMLRVYGPEGDVANGTYVPPPVMRLP